MLLILNQIQLCIELVTSLPKHLHLNQVTYSLINYLYLDLEECMQNIQNNIKLLYTAENQSNFHLGSYGVGSNSNYGSYLPHNQDHSEFNHQNDEVQYDTNEKNFEQLLDEKNKQIIELNQEIFELKNQQVQNYSQEVENYFQVYEDLKKQNDQIIQEKIELQEKLASTQMENEKDQIIEQLQYQIQEQQNLLIDKDDKLNFIHNKYNLQKDQLNILTRKYNELELTNQEQQQTIEYTNKENDKLRVNYNQISEELYQENQKNNKKYQENNQLDIFIDDIMQTIGHFVRQYHIAVEESDTKQSPELRRLIYQFIDNNRPSNNIIQDIELFSNLIVSLFEQLNIQLNEIQLNKDNSIQLQQQIISLEEIIVNLEKQLIQYESQYNQLEKLYQITGQQTSEEKQQLINKIMKSNKEESNIEHLKSVIKNLEDLNIQQQTEVQSVQEELSLVREEQKENQKMLMQEVNRTRQQEVKCKKLYQDSLFYKEMIQKQRMKYQFKYRILSVFSNEDINSMIDSLFSIQKDISICENDLLQIKEQLEMEEQYLKDQIKYGKIQTNELIDKRRQVEIMRSAYKNCVEQIKINQEKKEQIIFHFDHKIMYDRVQQTNYEGELKLKENTSNYINIQFNKRYDNQSGLKSKLSQKLQGFKV